MRVLPDAVWIDRSDIPVGFFGSSGGSYERFFWTNPLTFDHISRGIGNYAFKTTRTVLRTKGKRRYFANVRVIRHGRHEGIDFAAPTGTPVFAVADGIVQHVGPTGGFGNLVILGHTDNYQTYYAHLDKFAEGLEAGDEIAFVGSTGFSTGPHLHYELRRAGVYVNPMSQALDLNLWMLRPEDYVRLLKQCMLLDWCRTPA